MSFNEFDKGFSIKTSIPFFANLIAIEICLLVSLVINAIFGFSKSDFSKELDISSRLSSIFCEISLKSFRLIFCLLDVC